jgi:hypothetical protein
MVGRVGDPVVGMEVMAAPVELEVGTAGQDRTMLMRRRDQRHQRP